MRPSLSMRSSGILLHPTSLPGHFEFGDIGEQARNFVDFLRDSGQSWWQMCPTNPPHQNGSPYSALSAFAGNPALIDLLGLVEDGLLSVSQIQKSDYFEGDFEKHLKFKLHCLDLAFQEFVKGPQTGFEEFKQNNSYWLEEYAVFSALRKHYGKQSWSQWPAPLRRRDRDFFSRVKLRLAASTEFFQFVQFVFFQQMSRLKKYCSDAGVGLIGDVAIYVNVDSADTWTHQPYFDINSKGKMLSTGGTPPDLFSTEGQNWGMPTYRWDEMKKDHYRWWVERFKLAFQTFEAIRLDHFIGYSRYWRIPESMSAKDGHWEKGPGKDFFETVLREIPQAQFIAEDLGEIGPDVEELRDRFSFPGMKVLQFAFAPTNDAKMFLPENISENNVIYTGTHDNNTTKGWYEELLRQAASDPAKKEELDFLKERVGAQTNVHAGLIDMALKSKANVAIIPLQDILGLKAEARLNNPYDQKGNWKWRFKESDLSETMRATLKAQTEKSGRRQLVGAHENF